MADEPKKAPWILEHGFVLMQAASMVVLITLYVSGNVNRSTQAAADLVTVNMRLDRLFEKLDQINGSLPVLVEKVRVAEDQITRGKGDYASLDVRLREIERNNAANHEDINAIRPDPRHLNPGLSTR